MSIHAIVGPLTEAIQAETDYEAAQATHQQAQQYLEPGTWDPTLLPMQYAEDAVGRACQALSDALAVALESRTKDAIVAGVRRYVDRARLPALEP